MIDTTFRFCMHARAVLLAVALSSVLNAPVSAADPHETLYETQYQGLAMGTLITARLISPDDKSSMTSCRIALMPMRRFLRCTVRGRFTR